MSDNFLNSSFSPTGATKSGGDDFDFDRAASAFPDIDGLDNDTGFPSAPSAHTQNTNTGFDFEFEPAGAAGGGGRDVKVTENDDFDKFESEFPELEPQGGVFAPPPVQATATTPTFAPKPTQSAALAQPVLQHTEEGEEPEVLKQWRERQAERIRVRDEESEARNEETLAKAHRSIDKFYEDYGATKERNIKANKESETAFRQSLTDSLSEGTTWSRIASLIELENSQSKTLARSGAGTSDLTRYKEVLLRLKREGENAPGAAGY